MNSVKRNKIKTVKSLYIAAQKKKRQQHVEKKKTMAVHVNGDGYCEAT